MGKCLRMQKYRWGVTRTGSGRVLFLFLLLFILATGAFCQDRFPRPEFESGYELPESQNPPARSIIAEWGDTVVLLLFLAISAFAVYRLRRRWVMFLLSAAALGYFGFYRRGCICPVGAVQNITVSLAGLGYVVPVFVVLVFLLPIVVSLFYGRIFCASVCPLGALQDLVLVKPLRIPKPVAVPLSLLPVVMLGLTVLLAASGSLFLTCRLDPFVRVFRLEADFGWAIYAAVFLLVATVIARPYCRFLCPYGVILSWGARLAPRRVSATPDRCVRCGMCEVACPVDAIMRPTDRSSGPAPGGRSGEISATARRIRGVLILLALPVFMITAGWITSRLSDPISSLDARTRLLRRLIREDADMTRETTIESEAFREGDRTIEELEASVSELRRRLGSGGWIVGGCIGFVFAGRGFSFLRRRRNRGYVTDVGACIGCGRCYEVCPRERFRRRNR